jgi:hypothetical protein
MATGVTTLRFCLAVAITRTFRTEMSLSVTGGGKSMRTVVGDELIPLDWRGTVSCPGGNTTSDGTVTCPDW